MPASEATIERAEPARLEGVALTRDGAVDQRLRFGLLQGLIVDGRVLVPDEIAVVGFDDIPFAAAAAVPLTSVRQPSALIGGTAMRILLDEADDPGRATRQTVFAPELVARASTGAP